jgi:hypothetical protein
MRAGRKPKSPEQHIARGDTRPSKVNFNAPNIKSPTAEDLLPPEELKGAGLKFWERHAKVMADAGMLKETDMGSFIDLAFTVREMELYRMELAPEKLSLTEKLLISRQLNSLRKHFLSLSVELCMTSVSRSRVNTGKRNPNLHGFGSAPANNSRAAANRGKFFGTASPKETTVAPGEEAVDEEEQIEDTVA